VEDGRYECYLLRGETALLGVLAGVLILPLCVPPLRQHQLILLLLLYFLDLLMVRQVAGLSERR